MPKGICQRCPPENPDAHMVQRLFQKHDWDDNSADRRKKLYMVCNKCKAIIDRAEVLEKEIEEEGDALEGEKEDADEEIDEEELIDDAFSIFDDPAELIPEDEEE